MQGQCIIHCCDGDSDSNLVSPQNLDSWKTLLRAAEIRKHLPLLNLAKDLREGEIPTVHYHRRCRSIFTLKKSLDSITQKDSEKIASASEAAEGNSRRPSRAAPSKSVVYDEKCIFCEKSSKYVKGQNTREPLIQCSELRADDQIIKAAVTKLDQRMLAITSRELVAAEGHYHFSCYRNYTRGKPAAKSRESSEDAEKQYEVAEKKAYEELFSYIRNELFPNPEVIPMTNLASRLQSSMKSLGVSQIKDSTKKHLRRRMETELGGSIHICSDENGKLLLYPDSLSMTELAKTVFSLKNELQHTRSLNSDDVVTKSALLLRNDIKKQDTKQVWPPNVEQSEFLIPESIIQFLKTLLSGNCNTPSERVKRLVNSFGSDLVFAVTCGRIKPPKHVLLPFAVKSLGTFKLLKTDKTYQEAFLELGRSWTVSDELFKKLEEITCHMYVPSTHITDVNLLRYQLFCTRRGEMESSQLPPCKDCLLMHAIRANYQAAIWRRSLQTKPFVPSPEDHGWSTNEEGELEIKWMSGSPAPDAVLQFLSCRCVRSCKLPDCTCLSNGLKCTNLCKLQTCGNQCSEEEAPAQLTDSEEDEDIDD